MIPLDTELVTNLIKWFIEEKCLKNYVSNDVDSDEDCNDSYCKFSFTQDVYHTSMVTAIKDNFAFLGDKYSFDISKVGRDVYVGSVVTCIINSDGPGIINDVTVIDIEDELDEENSDERPGVKYGVIVKREERTFTVSPGPLSFNLDDVAAQFIPEVGDVVELGVKTEIINQFPETTVLKLATKGYKVLCGKVTSVEDGCGFINDSVLFQAHHCQPGYTPSVGDQVVFSSIKCRIGNTNSRAVHVNPVTQNASNFLFDIDVSELIFHPKEIIHVDLNVSKIIKTQLYNNSSHAFKLVSLKAHTVESNIELVEPLDVKMTINSKSCVTFDFKVTVKFIGFSSIQFDFEFEDHIFNCDLNVLAVDVKKPETPKNKVITSNTQTAVKNTSIFNNNSRKAIPGRRISKPCNFIPVKMGFYNIPNAIINLFDTGDDYNVTFKDLISVAPCLQEKLNSNNYKVYMHTLVYLEEIALLQKISKLQLQSGLIKNGDFLILYVEDDSHFSLLQTGDKVFAKKPWEGDDDVYEGIIWSFKEGEMQIKFSPSFHYNYVPFSEYIFTFQTGRKTFRCMHQAIDDVSSYLGMEWLFPEKADLKPPVIIPVNGPAEEDVSNYYINKNKKVTWNRQGSGYGSRQINTIMEQKIPLGRRRNIKWFNVDLNNEQKLAVVNILQGVSRPLPYIIFGPPGTGKSFTLLEVILQVYSLIPESHILVSAPSNSAADLLCLSLISSGFIKDSEFVRLCGFRYAHSGQVPQGLLNHIAVVDIKDSRENTDPEEMIKRINRYELAEKRIVIGTTVTLGSLRSMGFPRGFFTHCIIDEASQVKEPESLIVAGFLSKSGQIIFAGDPKQLGPVVISKHASRAGFHHSLIERIMGFCPYSVDKVGFPDTLGYNPKFVTKLVKSYRSLPSILHVSNQLFYSGNLNSMIDEYSSKEAKLYTLLKDIFPKNSSIPVLMHSIKGKEILLPGTFSFYNLEEVFQVCSYISRLYSYGISPVNIGVITPYVAQVKQIISYLENLNCEPPKVGSVEEFQGQERDVIIVSTVRSVFEEQEDLMQQLSFVCNPKRINVALTRAKSTLIIIGNHTSLCQNDNWRFLVSYCVDNKSFTN